MRENIPKVIIVVSGKRKSGKDYVTNNVVNEVSKNDCHIMRVAAPIKKHFCQKYNMNYEEMMTASQYKEQRREEMIRWGEEQRTNDSSIFCRAELKNALDSGKSVWILSDARRPSDVDYFRKYAQKTGSHFYAIRVSADIDTRESRGWKFTKNVDDVDSECALDLYQNWDYQFDNSSQDNVLESVKILIENIKRQLSST